MRGTKIVENNQSIKIHVLTSRKMTHEKQSIPDIEKLAIYFIYISRITA